MSSLRMSQDSNTTSDTSSGKPRLQLAKPKDGAQQPAAPASGSAPEAPAALPRFSFARKKPAEAPPPPAPAAPPPPSGPVPLKRPPAGSKIFPANEIAAPEGAMPAPLRPVSHAPTKAPFPIKAKPASNRRHLALLALLAVFVLLAGAEFAYILMHGEDASDDNVVRQPIVINAPASGAGQPAVVTATSSSISPAAKFLQNMSVDYVSVGAKPVLAVGGHEYHPGEIVDKDTGIKWILIDDKARQMEFVDRQGRHYIKKF